MGLGSFFKRDKKTDIQALYDVITQKVDELSKLQSEYTQLDTIDRPHLEELIEGQKKQNSMVEYRIKEMKKEYSDLQQLIMQESEKRDQLSKELETENEKYQMLVSETEANDQSIKRLQKNVEDLKGKNNEEKVRQLKQQLLNETHALKTLEANKDALQEEITSMQIKKEDVKISLAQLEKEKAQYENDIDFLERQIAKLNPYSSAEYRERARKMEEQICILQTSENSIKDTIRLLCDVIGENDQQPGWEKTEVSVTAMEETLETMKKTLNRFRIELMTCANSISNSMKIRRNES